MGILLTRGQLYSRRQVAFWQHRLDASEHDCSQPEGPQPSDFIGSDQLHSLLNSLWISPSDPHTASDESSTTIYVSSPSTPRNTPAPGLPSSPSPIMIGSFPKPSTSTQLPAPSQQSTHPNPGPFLSSEVMASPLPVAQRPAADLESVIEWESTVASSSFNTPLTLKPLSQATYTYLTQHGFTKTQEYQVCLMLYEVDPLRWYDYLIREVGFSPKVEDSEEDPARFFVSLLHSIDFLLVHKLLAVVRSLPYLMTLLCASIFV